MIPSIMCYVTPFVELLGPPTLQFSNSDPLPPHISKQIDAPALYYKEIVLLVIYVEKLNAPIPIPDTCLCKCNRDGSGRGGGRKVVGNVWGIGAGESDLPPVNITTH